MCKPTLLLVRSSQCTCLAMLTPDSRGSLVEYSHRINQDDPRDVEMIQASEDCRIAVVRKRVTDPETKAVRVVTSVWAFSDDNTTRVELRMEDDQMYIPYSSYFNPAKASITVLCELIFHDVKHGNRPVRIEKTSWVNYVFDSPQGRLLKQHLRKKTMTNCILSGRTLPKRTNGPHPPCDIPHRKNNAHPRRPLQIFLLR